MTPTEQLKQIAKEMIDGLKKVIELRKKFSQITIDNKSEIEIVLSDEELIELYKQINELAGEL